jgi:hypothetical protein
MTDTAREFRRRWWLANSVGFAVGLVAFSLLGHGFTGPHEDELTVAQYIGHTGGLVGAATIILAAQRLALQPLREVSDKRMAIGVLAFVAVFWFGAEAIRPPTDWILGFSVLGVAAWIRRPSLEHGKNIWALAALRSYWVGICAALAAVITWDRALGPDPSSLLDHTIGWLIVGATTGVVGGLLSAHALSQLLVAADQAES